MANTSTVTTRLVKIDDTAPSPSDDAPPTYVHGPVVVHVSAVDTLSGVATRVYSTDDSTPTITYPSSGVTITAEGTTTVKYRSTDVVGNASSVRSSYVRIDDTAPTSSVNATSTYVTTATITIGSTDAYSGVAGSQWRLDGSAWTSGTLVTTTTVGSHTLQYRSTDVVGNVEDTRSVTFDVVARFDEGDSRVIYGGSWIYSPTPPATSAGGDSTATAGSAAYASFTGTRVDVIVSKSPGGGIGRVTIDNTSPVTIDYYDVDYLSQVRALSVQGLANAPHLLKIEWTGSKNASSSGTAVGFDALDTIYTITPDTTAPVTVDDVNSAWRPTNATVSLTATDAHNYVAATRYRINASALATYTVPFAVTTEGTNTVEYFSVDGAGNTRRPRPRWCASTSRRRRVPMTHPQAGSTRR